MPGKNTNASYDLINEYEKKSQGKTCEEKKELIKEFIGRACING